MDLICSSCGVDITGSGAVRLTQDIPSAYAEGSDPSAPPDSWYRDSVSEQSEKAADSSEMPTEVLAAAPAESAPTPPRVDQQRAERPAPADHPAPVQSAQRPDNRKWLMAGGALILILALIPIGWVTARFLNPPPLAPTSGAAVSSTAPKTSQPPSAAPTQSSTEPTAAETTSESASESPTPTETGSPLESPSTVNFPPDGAKVCGDGVAAGKNTSCEFANAVAAKVDRSNTGTQVVSATSPVTNKTYEMVCNREVIQITCTGGNAATVFVLAAS